MFRPCTSRVWFDHCRSLWQLPCKNPSTYCKNTIVATLLSQVHAACWNCLLQLLIARFVSLDVQHLERVCRALYGPPPPPFAKSPQHWWTVVDPEFWMSSFATNIFLESFGEVWFIQIRLTTTLSLTIVGPVSWKPMNVSSQSPPHPNLASKKYLCQRSQDVDFRNKEVEFTFRVQPTFVQVQIGANVVIWTYLGRW